jgi:hypothetical protein
MSAVAHQLNGCSGIVAIGAAILLALFDSAVASGVGAFIQASH